MVSEASIELLAKDPSIQADEVPHLQARVGDAAGGGDAGCNLNNTLTGQLPSKDEGRKFFTYVLDRFCKF